MQGLLPRMVALSVIALVTLTIAAPAAGADWVRGRTSPLPEIGCEPPDFALPTPGGTVVDINAYRGKVILLTFCAGYTDTCCEIVKALTPLLDRYEAQGLVAPLVFSVIPPVNVRDQCSGLTAIVGDRFPTLVDDGRQLKGSYQVRELPTCFVIGRDFCIRDRVRGESVFYTAEFRALLEELLAEKP